MLHSTNVEMLNNLKYTYSDMYPAVSHFNSSFDNGY